MTATPVAATLRGMTMTATEGQLDFDAPLHDPSRDRPGGQHEGARDTERAAAKAKESPRTTAQRLLVLEHLAACGDGGATDYELSIACHALRTSVGKRRGELVRDNWCRDSGQRRKTDTNSTAVVWTLTDAGREAWGKR